MASYSHSQSKYRHIYGDAAKTAKQFTDLKNPMTSGESQYVKANGKYVAYGKAGGGAQVFVHKLSDVGRIKADKRGISTHKGRLTDFDFHPFIENMIATAADDCQIHVTQFPECGVGTTAIKEATMKIQGHRKKIAVLKFHPSANNIIASGAYDRTVRVFNIENASQICKYDAFTDNIYSVEWNRDGSLIAATAKDKQLRLFDPRKPDTAMQVKAFEGIKSSKIFFVPAYGWIGCTGCNKAAQRTLKLWDVRTFDSNKPLYSQKIDQSASVLVPRFDSDINVLFLAGKGDNSVTYWEMMNDDKKVYPLSTYRDGIPQKGGGWVDKRGLDVWKCEVQRFMKLTKNAIIPISFVVPRKSGADVFQEDIYPNCVSTKPAMTSDEWSAGANKEPNLMSMDPENKADDDDDVNSPKFQKKKTYDEVCQENKDLLQRIAGLEETVKALKAQLGIDDANDDGDADEANDDGNEANQADQKEPTE